MAATTSVVPENASAIRLLASISDTTATTSREDGDDSEAGGDLLQAGDLHGDLLHAREARSHWGTWRRGGRLPSFGLSLPWLLLWPSSSAALRSARDGFDGFAGFSRFFFGSCSSVGSESVKKLEDSISLTGMYLSVSCGGLYGRGEA